MFDNPFDKGFSLSRADANEQATEESAHVLSNIASSVTLGPKHSMLIEKRSSNFGAMTTAMMQRQIEVKEDDLSV